MFIDGGKDDGIGDNIDGGDKHLTHLTQAVGCCLKARSEQSTCVDDDQDDSVDNIVDGGDKHLAHLTQDFG
eukprot:13621861-Ditylum_brightwellii.AAC.1